MGEWRQKRILDAESVNGVEVFAEERKYERGVVESRGIGRHVEAERVVGDNMEAAPPPWAAPFVGAGSGVEAARWSITSSAKAGVSRAGKSAAARLRAVGAGAPV